MDNMTILLIVLACIFMLLALVLLIRYLSLKAELKRFKEQIKEIRTTDREQPIKVASFGVSSVTLAEEINLLSFEIPQSSQPTPNSVFGPLWPACPTISARPSLQQTVTCR